MTPSDNAIRHLVDQIHTAAHEGARLRVRGGGSKDFYGAWDAQAGIVDTKALQRIVSYEPTELVITALAGTPLSELKAELARQHQYLAFDPPHFGDTATVGGMVASGLSGPGRARHGALRDYVLGVHLINGQGQYLRFGGQVMKNVAGYDVSRLMAGSLGQLGVITQVSLKVVGRPAAHATVRFDWDQATALQHMHPWRSQALPLESCSWVVDSGQPTLYLRLCGARAAVQSAIAMMQAAGGHCVDHSTEATQPSVEEDWRAQREQTLPFYDPPTPQSALWRLSVPATTPVLDLPPEASTPLIEWFGALRWVWAPLSAQMALTQLAQRSGGHATLFRPPANATAQDQHLPRFAPLEPTLAHLNAQVKAALDPHHVFDSRL